MKRSSTPNIWAACLVGLCMALLANRATAAELGIDLGHRVQRYSTEQLLARSDVQDIDIAKDVAFGRPMHYRAVPLQHLLAGLQPGQQVQFVAADGFAVTIDTSLVLGTTNAKAWLAIEDPARPWPRLDHDGHVGPFYVVWMPATGIGSEQWPYALAGIRLQKDAAARFPAMVPPPSAGKQVQRGFAAFQRTCFACHTLNRQGDAQLGPDLNLPHNPTEYLRDDLLRAYIRDPQTLHHWPQAKMHGLDTQTLPDADLDAVLAYLRYMAQHKAQP
jgi:mono/diheme cytochrome c family protein